MPKQRVTLCLNARQTTRTLALLDLDSSSQTNAFETVLNLSKNKLRIKKPTRIFRSDGIELLPSWTNSEAISLLHDDVVLQISQGEDYVGVGKPSTKGGVEDAVDVKVIADRAEVDPEAIKQLKAVARMEGVVLAVGQPDLHPGNKFPIGATVCTQGCIYPPLIGGDIGCGMALWRGYSKVIAYLNRAYFPELDLKPNVSPTKIAQKIQRIEGAWTSGSPMEWLSKYGIREPTGFEDSLGTIGGGNHFAEVQEVEEVLEGETFERLGLKRDRLALLVHSGSRGFGQHILHATTDLRIPVDSDQESTPSSIKADTNRPYTSPDEIGEPSKVPPSSSPFVKYMHLHDMACTWARANRDLIAHRVISCLGSRHSASMHEPDGVDPVVFGSVNVDTEGEYGVKKVLDIWHNNVVRFQVPGVGDGSGGEGDSSGAGLQGLEGKTIWVHRKGAAPSDQGPVVIPGSRGARSYLVMPRNEDGVAGFQNAWSLAHGAGRLITRSQALQKGTKKYLSSSSSSGTSSASLEELYTTSYGSRVICEDRTLLFEEAPTAYKDIDAVVDDLVKGGFCDIVAIYKPVCTYKMRSE